MLCGKCRKEERAPGQRWGRHCRRDYMRTYMAALRAAQPKEPRKPRAAFYGPRLPRQRKPRAYRTTPREKMAADARRRYADPVARAKIVCRNKLGAAVRAGTITRGPCETCGTTERVQAHHEDYSKPLCVRWLCFKCHHAEHRSVRTKRQQRTEQALT